jgi:hypothetical protein
MRRTDRNGDSRPVHKALRLSVADAGFGPTGGPRMSSGLAARASDDVPEVEEGLARYARLSAWWEVMRERKSIPEVAMGLPLERPSLL